jgi:hypothetical protein
MEYMGWLIFTKNPCQALTIAKVTLLKTYVCGLGELVAPVHSIAAENFPAFSMKEFD